MPSLRTLTSFASSLLAQTPLLSTYSNAPGCPVDSPLSCHNSTAEPSCCFITPSGQLLLTQFWDTNPTVGPVDSWTLHGLWPDNCDGSYPQYCHSAPQYHNITSILSSHSVASQATLSYMYDYWLPNAGTLEHFWQHEWNKHGTCVNTLAPSCYGEGYTPGEEVVDFFGKAVEQFKGLDTYKALAAEGIEPSAHKTYTREEIRAALEKVTGFEVILGCRGGRLDEAWYSFNVRGSLQNGAFVATAPAGKGGRGSCPERGIRYLPKN